MIQVPGEGPSNAQLMIVGEAPGFHEVQQGKPFVGPSGQVLNEILASAGIRRDEVYITNVIKERLSGRDSYEKQRDIDRKIPFHLPILQNEIKVISPNCILALGGVALKYTTGKSGITKWRGSILPSIDGFPKVVPSLHPAVLFKRTEGSKDESIGAGPWRQKVIIEFDVQRAVAQSRFKDIKLPQRTLHVCHNSLDLYRFIARNRHNKTLVIDIETYKEMPLCIGLAFEPHEAVSVPLLELMTPENLTGIPMHELKELWRMVDGLLSDKSIGKIGHNVKFDQRILERFGFRVYPVVSDTMLMFHTLYPELPKKLQFVSSIYTEEPYYKDEGREFNPKKDDISRLYLYNAKDAAVTIECQLAMLPDLRDAGLEEVYHNKVMPLHDFYLRLERRGLIKDKKRCEELKEKYHKLDENNDQAIAGLVGHELNVNSWKQVAWTLFEELKCPRRKDVGEETLLALKVNVIRDEKRKEIIDKVLEGRKIKKTISVYLNAKEDSDGRIRTTYNVAGTETFRTSTSKLKPPVRAESSGIAFQTLTKHGSAGADIRSMFVSGDGFVFIEPDLSQAEARVVALLSNDTRAIEAFDKGEDIHKLTASWILGVSLNEVTYDQRFQGKVCRHAGNYDLTKRGLSQLTCISEWKADKILEKFHGESPGIRNIFHAQVREALERNNCILTGPFGHKRQFFERWGNEMFKEAYAFIPQNAVTTQTKLAMIRIEKRFPYIEILQESHDSFLGRVPEYMLKECAKIIEEELERPIDFSRCSLPRNPLIIPCEIKIGHNWGEMGLYECHG